MTRWNDGKRIKDTDNGSDRERQTQSDISIRQLFRTWREPNAYTQKVRISKERHRRADAGAHRTDHLWRQQWALALGVKSKQPGESLNLDICVSLKGAVLKSNSIEL